MICIFCFEERPESEEHVFPESIGGGFSIRRLCKCCNGRFGRDVDPLLIKHVLTQMSRSRYKVGDKRGKVPQMFSTGILQDPVGDAGLRDVRVKHTVDPTTGIFGMQILPTIQSEIGESGETTRISGVFSNETDARAWFQAELKRRGTIVESNDEFEALWQQSVTIGQIEKPTARYTVMVDSFRYRQALTKIAYEMAWHWLGDSWLQDAVARKMRKILRGAPKEKLPLHGLMEIGTTASELLPAIINWLDIQPYEHLALLLVTGGRAGLYISIFNMFFAVVDVTSKPDEYQLADLRDIPAKALLLDARNLDFTETTLATLSARRAATT